MEPTAQHNPMLTVFARQHTALLDAMAGVWFRAGGASWFAWRDDQGHVLYSSGSPTDGEMRAGLAWGTLSISDRDISFQPMLAAQARLLQEAIEREVELNLLTDDLMRTTDQLVAMYEMSAAARAGRGVDDVMQTCVEQAVRLTGAQCAVLTIREATREDGAARAFVFPTADAVETGFAEAILTAQARARDPVIANSESECAALCNHTSEPVACAIFAPIPLGGGIEAGLCALNKPADFVSDDLKLIAALADMAAGFLERDRNYRREVAQARVRRELEIAAEIQNRLLPRQVPGVPGAQVVAFSRAASEVGGDFFDAQVLPGNVLALALGDVTGRGVPAALFMAMARVLLRVGLQATQSPAGAVAHLNAGLTEDLSNADMLLTLFAATFDPASGALHAVNCGHSPVLVYTRSEAEVWEADGPPLGILPGVMSAERSRTLNHGDVLAVLSDGFSEARDAAGRRIGIPPLAETLRRTAEKDVSEIAAALQELATGGLAPEDDQTLIVMKVE